MAPSQTFLDHIHEIRKRVFWVIGTVGVSAGVSYAVRGKVLDLLQKPLGSPLFYSTPGGGFNFVLKLSMIIGMFITLPVIIYHLLRFLEPALPVRIKTSAMLKVIGASSFLAAAGIAFGYLYMIPQSLHFFGGFSTSEIKPLISADSYLSYVINNLITFAIAFQIPLAVLFINWIRPIKPGTLLKYQRHVVVGAFSLAVVLPFTYDPISQFMVAIPIIGLFYVSIVLLFIANRKSKRVTTTPFVAPIPVASVPQTVGQEEQRPLFPLPTPQSATGVSFARKGLSMDGMRGMGGIGQGLRPTLAFAKVAPQPSIQQGITKPAGVNLKPTKNRQNTPNRLPNGNHRQPRSIDGFFKQNYSLE